MELTAEEIGTMIGLITEGRNILDDLYSTKEIYNINETLFPKTKEKYIFESSLYRDIVNKYDQELGVVLANLGKLLSELEGINADASGLEGEQFAGLSDGTGSFGSNGEASTVTMAEVKTVNPNGNLNLREGPGTENGIITSIPNGTQIKVIEKDDGSGWVKVELEDGSVGYVSKNYIELIEPTNSPSPANVGQGDMVRARTLDGVSNLNVRAEANGQVVGSIPNGTQMEVIEEDKDGWTKVRLEDGREVFVSSKRIDHVANSETNFQANSEINFQANSFVKTNDTNGKLNLRSGPGMENSVKQQISNGTKMEVIGEDNNGWVEVRLEDNTTGFVSSKYVNKINETSDNDAEIL